MPKAPASKAPAPKPPAPKPSDPKPPAPGPPAPGPLDPAAATRRSHLAWGFTGLALWAGLGLLLEILHGFKIGWYLDVGVEARRLMLQLAHAHGALLGGVHLAFALAQPWLTWGPKGPGAASRLLKAGSLLLPGGFLLGGIWIRGGDPGLGILPAPLGGLLLCAALALTARAALRAPPPESAP